MLRKILAIIRAITAIPAAATRLVWEGGKWIAKSVFAPAGAQTAAADAALSAALDDEQASVDEAAFTEMTPEHEWGTLAQDFAHARFMGAPEPDLAVLDEAAAAWLRGLSESDLSRVTSRPASSVGSHMLGGRLITGLPRCPTLTEHYEAEATAQDAATREAERWHEHRQVTLEILQDLVDSTPASRIAA